MAGRSSYWGRSQNLLDPQYFEPDHSARGFGGSLITDFFIEKRLAGLIEKLRVRHAVIGTRKILRRRDEGLGEQFGPRALFRLGEKRAVELGRLIK